jgi:hypothetical protein
VLGGGASAVLVLVAGALFVLSGLYNVSASREHLDVTTWLLDLVRRQSIRTQPRSAVGPAGAGGRGGDGRPLPVANGIVLLVVPPC